ncbi:MAG TPA: nucleotidyltransferase family protein [Salinivirgaceae bacterium]|nr:nucleotidyltransferase family protein [Salinivirgaceae bacterium]
MMDRNYILNKLRELKPFLNKEYSVKEIGLFGSFASDSARDDSDIDLLIVLEKPIGWKFFSLEIYLEQVFGRKIDLVTKNALRDRLKEDILNKVNYV